MGISRGKWADLPIDILDDMLTRSSDVGDFIRFGGVCRSWRCASLESKNTNKNSFVPWMMLSEPEPRENFLDEETLMLITMFNQQEVEDKDKDAVPPPRKFVNLCTKKTIELYLPEGEGTRCLGSKFGWILTIGLDLNIHLLNPLTRLQISLPPQTTFGYQFRIEYEYDETYDPFHGEGEIGFLRRMYLEKFALSAHPNDHHGASCVVMVIYSDQRLLAFARPGDKAWTDVKCHRKHFTDVIFFKNVFFAVQLLGDLVVCDITNPVPVATDFMPPPISRPDFCKYYLVEMSGGLHLVARVHDTGVDNFYDGFTITLQFEVYRLDFGRRKWIKLRKLGNHTLFLGNNISFAISHPDLPTNCIYFTDDFIEYYKKSNCDIGLFDFGEQKVVDPLYSGDCIHSTFGPPLFFMPNLH